MKRTRYKTVSDTQNVRDTRNVLATQKVRDMKCTRYKFAIQKRMFEKTYAIQ